MSRDEAWRSTDHIAGGRLCRPGGKVTSERVEVVKEGAHGGTMGSPMPNV